MPQTEHHNLSLAAEFPHFSTESQHDATLCTWHKIINKVISKQAGSDQQNDRFHLLY